MKKVYACVLMLCPMVALAQDAANQSAAEETPTVSAEFVDPAFDRYVDVSLLGAAWESQDAAALTDVALQLAEGEKALFRSHKTFTSKDVFEKALAVAADQKDSATLERLAKIAKACDCKDFAAKVAQTTKLAADSRAILPNLKFLKVADNGKVNHHYIYTAGLISRVRVTGDKKALASIKEQIKQTKPEGEVTKESLDALAKLADESDVATGEVPEAERNVGFALEKLAGESRHWPPGGPRPPYPLYPGGPRPPYPVMGPRPPYPWMGPPRPPVFLPPPPPRWPPIGPPPPRWGW